MSGYARLVGGGVRACAVTISLMWAALWIASIAERFQQPLRLVVNVMVQRLITLTLIDELSRCPGHVER